MNHTKLGKQSSGDGVAVWTSKKSSHVEGGKIDWVPVYAEKARPTLVWVEVVLDDDLPLGQLNNNNNESFIFSLLYFPQYASLS